jgi:hypothetical protein
LDGQTRNPDVLLDSGFAPSGRALRGPVAAPRNNDLYVSCAFSGHL